MRAKYRTRRDFVLKGGLAAGGLIAASSQVCAWSSELPRTAERLSGGGAPLRGVMVDAARVPERMEYYRRVVDFCADWGLNAVQFRIADDQGSAMRFSSAPDLLFHEHAFSPEQLRGLAQYGNSRGVELIPELESFGHTGYITRSAAYAHLLDADPKLPAEFTGVIPVHPETLELFRKLYREIATVFPSVFLHGGCDEVNWGGSSLSRKALETKPRYAIWAEYLNSLNGIAEGLGKQFIVWGDFVLHKEPEILARLSKKIIVMDWNYTETSSARVHEALATIRKNGSRAIGAPALINYRWGARAGAEQLKNIDAFADAYLGSEDAGSLGVILTNWVPSRYIQNSIWDGFAYGAVAFKEGSGVARAGGFRRFVEKHYRAMWNKDWDEAFRLVYESAPKIKERDASGAVPLHLPWSSGEELAKVLKARSGPSYPFARVRALLDELQGQVSENRADFTAFQLAVAYLDQVYWRERAVQEFADKTMSSEDAAQAIRRIAERDHTQAEMLSRDWDDGRFADSAGKLKPLFGFEPKDQLVFQFQRAAEYSGSLASHPDRFVQLVRASKKA